MQMNKKLYIFLRNIYKCIAANKFALIGASEKQNNAYSVFIFPPGFCTDLHISIRHDVDAVAETARLCIFFLISDELRSAF